MQRKLILIRHSSSEPTASAPPEKWPLSEAGRVACQSIAEAVRSFAPSRIVTSTEPKAADTGMLIGTVLGIPVTTAIGLHEHVRTRVPWLGREAFEATVKRFFDNPDTLIFGEETASAARERFEASIQRLLLLYPHETIAIATHGTVLTLFMQAHCEVAPFPFWQQLRMPDYFVLSLPEYRLLGRQR